MHGGHQRLDNEALLSQCPQDAGFALVEGKYVEMRRISCIPVSCHGDGATNRVGHIECLQSGRCATNQFENTRVHGPAIPMATGAPGTLSSTGPRVRVSVATWLARAAGWKRSEIHQRARASRRRCLTSGQGSGSTSPRWTSSDAAQHFIAPSSLDGLRLCRRFRGQAVEEGFGHTAAISCREGEGCFEHVPGR
jgi:hypothetical protein